MFCFAEKKNIKVGKYCIICAKHAAEVVLIRSYANVNQAINQALSRFAVLRLVFICRENP